MARYEVINTYNGFQYTKSLGDSELFPVNTPLEQKLFLSFANSKYAPYANIEFSYQSQYNANTKQDATWAIEEPIKPVLYRIDANRNTFIAPPYYNNEGFTPTVQEGSDYIFDEQLSPTTRDNAGYNLSFGYNVRSKGIPYDAYYPIVGYNPNRVVVVPYLARVDYINLIANNTFSVRWFTDNNSSPIAYQNIDMLMLDDIKNDTIVSQIGQGQLANNYFLGYFLLMGNRYWSNYWVQSTQYYSGYALIPRPLIVKKPIIYSEKTRNDGYNVSICKDLLMPIYAPRGILIGAQNIGSVRNSSNQIWYTVGTQYCDHEIFPIGKVGNISKSIESGLPCVKVANLAGANTELYNNLVKTAASLGFPIVTSWAAANAILANNNEGINDTLIDQYPTSIYYPNLDKTGKVTDKVDSGDSAKTNPLKVMGDEGVNPYDETPIIDPDDESDTNEYVDEVPLHDTLVVNPANAFNSRYAMSESDLRDFEDFLWTGNQSIITSTLEGLKMFGENPMNFFLGLKMFPFDVTHYATTHPQNITFGNGVDTGILGDLLSDINIIIDLGTINFRKYFKNFLDYEPYTTAKLYVPYCGEIQVETALFVGHTIGIKVIVDVITGSCCAVVSRDGMPCLYMNGNIAVDIPITGENLTAYVESTKSMLQQTAKTFDGLMTMGVSGSKGQSSARSTNESLGTSGEYNIVDTYHNSTSSSRTKNFSAGGGGMISSITGGLIGAYDWNTTPTPLQITGTASDLLNFYKPQWAYFCIEQPVPMSIAGYGTNTGYACFEHGRLPTTEGELVICNNANIQPLNATSLETAEINELLNTGVWI